MYWAWYVKLYCAWSSFSQNWGRRIINKIYYYYYCLLGISALWWQFLCSIVDYLLGISALWQSLSSIVTQTVCAVQSAGRLCSTLGPAGLSALSDSRFCRTLSSARSTSGSIYMNWVRNETHTHTHVRTHSQFFTRFLVLFLFLSFFSFFNRRLKVAKSRLWVLPYYAQQPVSVTS